ncbi:SCO family protein [Nocardioides daphniae]|uniref:SCO family protein n=1 Tax=Nocardioides daphniae TaxID=402297 RepID=A0A4P7UAU2_9ACTN|nr:SCO family protein [Nocardioides daphniae]
MTRGWGRRLALGLAAGVLATGALACSPATQEPSEAGIYGAELDQPYEAAAIPLTTTSGEERALADVDNDLTLVFFGYTHCPDICGVVMSTIASALTQVDEELRDRVDMVFVTTDPARDDAEVLRATSTATTPSSRAHRQPGRHRRDRALGQRRGRGGREAAQRRLRGRALRPRRGPRRGRPRPDRVDQGRLGQADGLGHRVPSEPLKPAAEPCR